MITSDSTRYAIKKKMARSIVLAALVGIAFGLPMNNGPRTSSLWAPSNQSNMNGPYLLSQTPHGLYLTLPFSLFLSVSTSLYPLVFFLSQSNFISFINFNLQML